MRGPLHLDGAHVINLAARPQRYKAFTHHIRHELGWPLPLHRFNAIDTLGLVDPAGSHNRETLSTWVDPKAAAVIHQGFRTEHHQLTQGAVGCALSHWSLWNLLASHSRCEYMLIFEDDAQWRSPHKLSWQQLYQFVQTIPNDWDMLSLGCQPREATYIKPHYQRLDFFHQLHAYLIHRSAVAKLCKNFFPLQKQLDTVVSEKTKSDDLLIYQVLPNFFVQTWQKFGGDRGDCQEPLQGTPTRHY